MAKKAALPVLELSFLLDLFPLSGLLPLLSMLRLLSLLWEYVACLFLDRIFLVRGLFPKFATISAFFTGNFW